MTTQGPITSFRGPFGFLSNFYAINDWQKHGLPWPTSEHGFQSKKASFKKGKLYILAADTAAEAKRRAKEDVAKRKDWQDIKEQVMLDCLRIKFSVPYLKRLLLSTGERILVEGNHWGDTYWGVCNGVGENRLGYLLMEVRQELKEAE